MHTSRQTDRRKATSQCTQKVHSLFGPFLRIQICSSFRINRGSEFKTLDFHFVDLGSLPGSNHVNHCSWLQEGHPGKVAPEHQKNPVHTWAHLMSLVKRG